MKEIHNIVASEEYSKMLFDRGLSVPNIFYWVNDGTLAMVMHYKSIPDSIQTHLRGRTIIPAYTIAELVGMLPTKIVKDGTSYYLMIIKKEDGFEVCYQAPTHPTIIHRSVEDDMENACAQMVCLLYDLKMLH